MTDREFLDPDPADRQNEPETSQQDRDGDEPGAPKNLLEMEGDEAAKAMQRLWDDRSELPEVQQSEARWEVNRLRRAGFTGVRLKQDGNGYKAWLPLVGGPTVEGFNKARTLCRTFTGNMLADPPAPHIEPTDGSDDRDKAEVAERALLDLQGPHRLNTQRKLRRALDKSCTYSSGFIRYFLDDTAGGRRPKTIMASPLAVDAQHPLLDPTTGGPYQRTEMTAAGPVIEVPPPIERYVTPQQQITDDAMQADYEWRRDLKSEVLTGKNVRLIPHTADVTDALGVMIGTFISWGQAKSMFRKELGEMPEEEVRKLLNYRPQRSEQLMPRGRRSSGSSRSNLDEQQVFLLTIVYYEHGTYPDGFYGCAIGGKKLVHKQAWMAEVDGKREPLLLPIVQIKQFDNGEDDATGGCLMDDLGGANEVRYAQIGHALHYLDKFNNLPFFVPTNSTITEQDLLQPRRAVIRHNPGGEPKTINPPAYPDMSMVLYQETGTEMDSASHMQQAAQGVEDPSVQSGRHAYQIIAQVHAQLSEPKQNIEDAYVRCCRIEMQYARAFQLDGEAKWTGEDGAYKVRAWKAADLEGDVRIKQGTMTLLSPAAKAELAERYAKLQILPPDELRDIITTNLGPTVGLQDNPYRMEIRRSIDRWKQGPPDGWQPAPTEPQVQQDPVTMQPILPPPPPEPMIAALFSPSPHHSLPGVAQIRVDELAKVMASVKAQQFDASWRGILAAEFQRLLMVLQPPAPPVPGGAPPGQGAPPPPNAPPPGMPALDPPTGEIAA